MSNYRDPLTVALAELAVRQRNVAARLAEVRDAHRAVLSQPLRALLNAAPSVTAASPTTLDAVNAVAAELGRIEDAINRANAALSIDGPSLLASYADGALDGFGQWLNHVVAPWKGFARQIGDRWVAQARVNGVEVELEAIVTMNGAAFEEVRFAMTSRVPAALAAISVTQQGEWRSFAKRVLFASELEVGVRDVDDAYWIRGDHAAANAVLTPEVTKVLAHIRSYRPTLEIADGVARVEWVARSVDALNGAVFEGLIRGGPRQITDSIVPPAMFELHRAIRYALDPPPPAPQPSRIDELREALRVHAADAIKYPLDGFLPDAVKQTLAAIGLNDLPVLDELAASSDSVAPWARDRARAMRTLVGLPRPRIDEVREALREYCNDVVTYGGMDMVAPEPHTGPLPTLGPADLSLLDEIATSTDQEVAGEAASRAQSIRSGIAQKKVAAARPAAQLAELFARDATTRGAVVVQISGERDATYVAEVMTHLFANGSGAAFARAVSETSNPPNVVAHVVKALVAHSGAEAIEAMLNLPSLISIDTAVALLRFAPELAGRVRTMPVELRRKIATTVAATGDMKAGRRLFDDEDAEVRAAVVERNVQFPSREIAPDILEKLRTDPDARVRRAAARALGSVGTIESLVDEALAALHGTDAEVRDVAARSIAAIRATRSASYGERLGHGTRPVALLCPFQSLLVCDVSALPALRALDLRSPLARVSVLSDARSTTLPTSRPALGLRKLAEPVYAWRSSENEIDLFSRAWTEAELCALPKVDPPPELLAKLEDVHGTRIELPTGYVVILAMDHLASLPTETEAELTERAAPLGHCCLGGPRDDPPTRADGVCIRVQPGTYQVGYASLLVDVKTDVSIELYRLRPYP